MDREINEILNLVRKKLIIDSKYEWSKGSETYFEEIKKELDEVRIELDRNRKCFLEDELGDVFWDFMNLLVNLENEKKIELKNVFRRCHKKYLERLDAEEKGISWDEIKIMQKNELQKQQNLSNK